MQSFSKYTVVYISVYHRKIHCFLQFTEPCLSQRDGNKWLGMGKGQWFCTMAPRIIGWDHSKTCGKLHLSAINMAPLQQLTWLAYSFPYHYNGNECDPRPWLPKWNFYICAFITYLEELGVWGMGPSDPSLRVLSLNGVAVREAATSLACPKLSMALAVIQSDPSFRDKKTESPGKMQQIRPHLWKESQGKYFR